MLCLFFQETMMLVEDSTATGIDDIEGVFDVSTMSWYILCLKE